MAETPRHSLLVTGICTLTSTHCGTGQAAGAIDLPIAREAHTGLPLMPATTLKGVARDDWFGEGEKKTEWFKRLFGPPPPKRVGNRENEQARERMGDHEGDQSPQAGDLVFLDACLLAFPVRSLTGVFRMITSPLLLHRLRRLAAAHGRNLHGDFVCPEPEEGKALVADAKFKGPLSLEDLIVPAERCVADSRVKTLAKALGRFVVMNEMDTDRVALESRLVVVEDEALQDLTRRAMPVSARIVLTDKKTSENLWYEETLAPDCLFAAVIAARPGAQPDPVDELTHRFSFTERYTQIGGNASTGCGQCRWVVKPEGILS